jgi:hypothetical protein
VTDKIPHTALGGAGKRIVAGTLDVFHDDHDVYLNVFSTRLSSSCPLGRICLLDIEVGASVLNLTSSFTRIQADCIIAVIGEYSRK